MKHIYFAGGGTGGHIYPAIAVAEKLKQLSPDCKVSFFCSSRDIDSRILSGSNYDFVPLNAKGFDKNPLKWPAFLQSIFSAKKQVIKKITSGKNENPVLLSVGGFVSAPAVMAAEKLKIPVAMLNIDAVAGKANKVFAFCAKDIFVQFEQTAKSLRLNKKKVIATGCPLRQEFGKTYSRAELLKKLGLSEAKKTLLITGASGGAANINNAIGYLLDRLGGFANKWQLIHLAGITHYDSVRIFYKTAQIDNAVLDYCDYMAELLGCCDLAVARAGAMSIAEFCSAKLPVICLPYPYHKDQHQKLNAAPLVNAGAAVIVPDLCDTELTCRRLWPVLSDIMADTDMLAEMKAAYGKFAKPDAAEKIARILLDY